MCWAVPGRLVEIIDDAVAKVDFGGVMREVLRGFEDVEVGDLVMVHSGVVIGKISEQELVANLSLFMEAEALGLQDLGYSEQEAKSKALEEFRNLLTSLGLDAEKYDVGWPPTKENVLTETREKPRPEVPPYAYKERFRTTLSDMDYLQVMHYTNYFRLCERAWTGLLQSIGYGYSTLIHRYGVFIPTVESGGKIFAPVRMDNEVEVAVWVEEVGRKHIKYRGVITNLTSNRMAADIYHVAVCTDTTLMESMDLPKDLVERLSAFMLKE